MLVTALFLGCGSHQAISQSCPTYADGTSAGTVESALIDEASGLVVSRKNPEILWVHNDSGDDACVFAMNRQGEHLGIFSLSGINAIDWEDMATGPGSIAGQHYLYLGDIGDNDAERSSISVHRIPEPNVTPDQSPVTETVTDIETFTLTYPDGAHNAETLLVDPLTGDLYIATKESVMRLFRVAAADLTTSSTITMEYVTQISFFYTTGGDIDPTGRLIAIRGYLEARLWLRPQDMTIGQAIQQTACPAPLHSEPQGETLAFDTLGQGYFTVSEGGNQPLYFFACTGSCPQPGDYDLDGGCDMDDLAWLAEYWLATLPGDVMADTNADGRVDLLDFAAMADCWP